MSKIELIVPELQLGTPFEGGFYAGPYFEGLKPFALVVPPKALGQAPNDLPWKQGVKFCAELRIGEHDDWRAPTLLQASVLRANLLPSTTEVEAFKTDGPEAFDRAWYWLLDEFDRSCAWLQSFVNGNQCYDFKIFRYRVRAVRKVPL